MSRLREFRTEIGPTVRLAAPLVLAEIGWISMGIVDTIMVGRLPNGTEAIGATSLGNVLFQGVAVFGSGLLLGLDTLVAQAYGSGNVDDCHHSLLNSIYLVLAMSPLMVLLVWALLPVLNTIGVRPEILRLTRPYLRALLWSAPPLMVYFVFRRYLQGMNLVRPIAFALISANVVNVFGNWVLIYGNLGAPALGVAGSGWSTCIARVYMASVLLGHVLYYEWRHRWGLTRVALRPDPARLRRLLELGFPAALQISLEIGVFGTATALAGTLGAIPLAAHQVALQTASFTFMVPLGISAAAAVRVGQALGRRDRRGAGRAGWTAVALGACCMAASGLVLLAIPRLIVRIYSGDTRVIELGALLLTMAAVFQLFDGIQGVTVGALRGTGDTRTAMLAHLLCDWAVGLPVAWYFCFRLGWGVVGLWVGLSAAMILAGIVLLFAWARRL